MIRLDGTGHARWNGRKKEETYDEVTLLQAVSGQLENLGGLIVDRLAHVRLGHWTNHRPLHSPDSRGVC
jgi:hypothetical protein